jgi:hypothetical protein
MPPAEAGEEGYIHQDPEIPEKKAKHIPQSRVNSQAQFVIKCRADFARNPKTTGNPKSGRTPRFLPFFSPQINRGPFLAQKKNEPIAPDRSRSYRLGRIKS